MAETASLQVAESLRVAGDYSAAIREFDRVIASSPGSYWAFAHRGAARAALGNFQGAEEDLEKAEKLFPHAGLPYAWARVQKGELYRLWAHDALGQLPEGPERAGASRLLLDRSIAAFEAASADGEHVSPWLCAHLGAAYTMRYWLTRRERDGQAEKDYRLAVDQLKKACGMNPAYGWAYTFHAIVAGFHGDMNEAIDLLGKAQAGGPNPQRGVLKALMEVTTYSALGQEDEQARKTFQKAVELVLAWQVLQLDSEDAGARYVVADGLVHLEDDEAPHAIRRARHEIHMARDRLDAMLASLDLLEVRCGVASGGEELSDEEKRRLEEHARNILARLAQTSDIQTILMVQSDPAWEGAKSWTEHERIVSPIPDQRSR